jgi:hypothetical protein
MTGNKKGELMFYILVLLAAIFAMPAKADETLKWRHVQHLVSSQVQEIGDVNSHTLNIYRLLGIAFFPDGSTGTSLSVGVSDTVNGIGTVNGYYTINFGDDSELWLKYTGTRKFGNPKVAQKGTATVIGGKGRYAGATGDGTWEGEAIPAGPEVIAYIDNVINIKK